MDTGENDDALNTENINPNALPGESVTKLRLHHTEKRTLRSVLENQEKELQALRKKGQVSSMEAWKFRSDDRLLHRFKKSTKRQ